MVKMLKHPAVDELGKIMGKRCIMIKVLWYSDASSQQDFSL